LSILAKTKILSQICFSSQNSVGILDLRYVKFTSSASEV